MHNFFMLLDNFLSFRPAEGKRRNRKGAVEKRLLTYNTFESPFCALLLRVKQYARASPFEAHIYSSAVDLSPLRETLSYTPLVIHEKKDQPPLKWAEAHPVVGTQLLCPVLRLNIHSKQTQCF